MRDKLKIGLLVWVLAVPLLVAAQERVPIVAATLAPEEDFRLRVCSQNLNNYGLEKLYVARNRGKDVEDLKDQSRALARRFIEADCDVIAAQEILGKTIEDAELGLKQLARTIELLGGKKLLARAAPSNDRYLRLGFLYNPKKLDLVQEVSYRDVELPKLNEKAKPRTFARGPYEVEFKSTPTSTTPAKNVAFVNFHFKSKRLPFGDPAGLEFETHRMEMAEALRRMVVERHEEAFSEGDRILVLLGDRNSHFDTASARILEGVVELSHFQGDGVCRLSKRGTPLCKAGAAGPAKLFSVLINDPDLKLRPGTYRYEKTFSWIDDILIPAESLRFAGDLAGEEYHFNSGVIYEHPEASDHALIYTTLSW